MKQKGFGSGSKRYEEQDLPLQDPSEGNGSCMVRLGDMRPGVCGKISRLSCRGKLRRRLMDMGVVAGTPIRVERVAPLGDPIDLKLKGFHLSLRKEEAGDIWVEVEGDEE